MSKVSKYDELMATMIVRRMQDHLKVVVDTLVFTEVYREVMIELIDDLYRLLNEED